MKMETRAYRIAQCGGSPVWLMTADQEMILAHCPRKLSDQLVVGDWVTCDAQLQVDQIQPRTSYLKRFQAGRTSEHQGMAANFQHVWIVTSANEDFNLRRLERYLSLAWSSGGMPSIVVSKCDLITDRDEYALRLQVHAPGTAAFFTSSLKGFGIEQLVDSMNKGDTAVLIGSSGVGKSTLVNTLTGRSTQHTGAIRSDGKGRHITTNRILLPLPGGRFLIDTPGMREVAPIDTEGMDQVFPEIHELAEQCHFSDCSHSGEPGCAVMTAVDQGLLDADRLASFQRLGKEIEFEQQRHDQRYRLKKKQHDKTLARAIRQMTQKHRKYRD